MSFSVFLLFRSYILTKRSFREFACSEKSFVRLEKSFVQWNRLLSDIFRSEKSFVQWNRSFREIVCLQWNRLFSEIVCSVKSIRDIKKYQMDLHFLTFHAFEFTNFFVSFVQEMIPSYIDIYFILANLFVSNIQIFAN